MFNSLGTTWLTKRSVSTALGLAALLGITSSAQASLIAYEGFNYSDGSNLTNASGSEVGDGSFGWTGRWGARAANTQIATNYAGSFTYMDGFGNTLNTTGGHVEVGRGTGANPVTGNGQVARNIAYGDLGGASLNTYQGLSNGTFYVSYLMKWLGPLNTGGLGANSQYSRQGSMKFYGGAATNAYNASSLRLSVGMPNVSDWGTAANTNGGTAQWDVWSGNDGIGPDRDADVSSATVTDVSLVVMRFDLDGTGAGMDTVYTWFNPNNLTVESSTGVANSTVTNHFDLLNSILLQANNQAATGTNANIAFDEIRIGTTWGDVLPVPEPSAIALMGVALSGLWLTIRRRRQS